MKILTVNLIFVNSDSDSLGAELVDSLAFSHEHNFQFLSLGIIVNELGNFLICGIVLYGDVNCDLLLEFHNVVL